MRKQDLSESDVLAELRRVLDSVHTETAKLLAVLAMYRKRTAELERRISVLENEKSALSTAAEECDAKHRSLERELKEARKAVNELTTNLSQQKKLR